MHTVDATVRTPHLREVASRFARAGIRAGSLSRAFTELHSVYRALRDWSSVADQAALVLGPRAHGTGPEAQAAAELLALLRSHARDDKQDQQDNKQADAGRA